MKLWTKLMNSIGIKTAKQKAAEAKAAAISAKRSQAQKDAWARKKAAKQNPPVV